MKEIRHALTREEYEELITLSYNEQQERLFPRGIPETWLCGYGYYGHRICVLEGKPYAEFSLGDSCD